MLSTLLVRRAVLLAKIKAKLTGRMAEAAAEEAKKKKAEEDMAEEDSISRISGVVLRREAK